MTQSGGVTRPFRPRTRGAAAAAVLWMTMVLTLVACGGGDKAAPTTTGPDGFMVVQDAKEGFAVAVPSEWTLIPLSTNPAVFDKDANRLRLANPKLSSILIQARTLGQSGGILMAVAPDGMASVNITADKPKEKTVEEVVTASVAGLKNFEATNIVQEPTTISGEPAIKVTFRLPVETADSGTIPTDEVQHYLLHNKKAYILTVAGASPAVSAAIATSLRLR